MPESIRVLHLEDTPADAELIEQSLVEDGLVPVILLVTSRAEFVRALEAGGFDVILSDYRGPEFDGLTALADAQRICPNIPFIMITGTLGEEPAIEILKKGATDFVLKTRMQRIPQVVRRALREAAERRNREAAERALRHS